MSERGKITLGQMQDGCKAALGDCLKCETKIRGACHSMEDTMHDHLSPSHWNLTDPPRFNEAQMALLNGLYKNGVTKLKSDGGISSLFKADHEYIGNFINSYMGIDISDGEILDLAELLGKESE